MRYKAHVLWDRLVANATTLESFIWLRDLDTGCVIRWTYQQHASFFITSLYHSLVTLGDTTLCLITGSFRTQHCETLVSLASRTQTQLIHTPARPYIAVSSGLQTFLSTYPCISKNNYHPRPIIAYVFIYKYLFIN